MFGLPAVLPLRHGRIEVAPLRLRDWRELSASLDRNRTWLRRWQTTDPDGHAPADARTLVRGLVQAMNAGEVLAYAVRVDGAFAGQVTVSSIEYGALSTAQLGYWVSEDFAGLGVIPTATALVTDFALGPWRLHRMEICIRPENRASLRVVQKLGFRFEGRRRRYIHIDGEWRDHLCFAVTREEVPQGVLARFLTGTVPAHAADVPEAFR
jgi:ribosomal-protein-alanine N-acetyltransferase